MIADREVNNRMNPIVTKLFPRGGNLNISLVVLLQSYLKVYKTVR